MDRKWIKRLLSLSVAVEMFFSPVAMARVQAAAIMEPDAPAMERAEDSRSADLSTGERAETPADLGSETPTVAADEPWDSGHASNVSSSGDTGWEGMLSDGASSEEDADRPVIDLTPADGGDSSADGSLPSSDPDADPSTEATAGAALLDLPSGEFVADISFGIPLDDSGYPDRYGGFFTYESAASAKLPWGDRAHRTGAMKYFNRANDKLYTYLPNMGRLPDLEPEGFYLLGDAPQTPWWNRNKADTAVVRSWVYNENWPVDSIVRFTETDDPVPFNRGDDVDYDSKTFTTLAYLSNDEMERAVTRNVVQTSDNLEYYVPMVARWKESSKAHITFLSATTHTEGAAAGTGTELASVFTESPTGKADPASLEIATVRQRGLLINDLCDLVPGKSYTVVMKIKATKDTQYEISYNKDDHTAGENAYGVKRGLVATDSADGDVVTHTISNVTAGGKLMVNIGLGKASKDDTVTVSDIQVLENGSDIASVSYPSQSAGRVTEGGSFRVRSYKGVFRGSLTGNGTSVTMTCGEFATAFDEDTNREFWIRVPEDQDALTLQFEAYEPYFTYNVEKNGVGDAPVSVSAVFNRAAIGSVSVARGWSEDGAGNPVDAVYPKAAEDASGFYQPLNSVNAPARSRWTVANIPLAKVADAEDISDPYTTVTVTITAPDGTHYSRYVFHIERLMTPTYQLGLGNTPVAMIEKDVRGNWGNGSAMIRRNKDAAKASFRSHQTLGGGSIVSPGDYVYYRNTFSTLAWDGLRWGKEGTNAGEGTSRYYNVDYDESAVIAYQDTAFADPGVAFIGSDGRPVVFGSEAPTEYQNCVTRSIRLRTADKLTVDLYGGGGSVSWYNPGEPGRLYTPADPASADESKVLQVLRNADGSDGVDLRGLKVLPGVYTMTYTFTDPLTRDSIVAERPLVVLPIPGDVDMDGAVTMADALTYIAHKSAWESSAAEDIQLLRYRVMGPVTADAILRGFQPSLAYLGESDYFYPYLPTPADADSTYERKTWSEVTMTGSAKLQLRYLGLEQSILQSSGHRLPAANGVRDDNGYMGPWQVNAEGLVTVGEYDLNGNYKYGTYQTDTFWVGVYLTPGELAGNEVEDLTVSLIYDSDFVEPAEVYRSSDGETRAERWLSMVYNYNLGDGSKINSIPKTLFSGFSVDTEGNTGDYTFRSGSIRSRAYATHYSKVIGELESIQGAEGSALREMVFNIQSQNKSGSRRAVLPSGETCVLVVPFQLIKHPTGNRLDNDKARLVELGAGMRDFNLVTKAASGSTRASSSASMIAQLFAAMDTPASRAISPGDTLYAFSAQDSIYGGVTQNLKETVTYKDAEGQIPGMIPIGKNKTVAKVLKPAAYAEPYEAKLGIGGALTGDLPKGLTYSATNGEIVVRGTPEEVGDGEFNFTVTYRGVEYYYTLPVEKRQLHFWAVACGSYYGESKYRNGTYSDGTEFDNRDEFLFEYNKEDIAPQDIPAGMTLTGKGTELDSVLGAGYVKPTFTARLSRDSSGNDPVTYNTPVGVYPIVLDDGTALDENYELVLDQGTLSGQTMQVFPRPVWIHHIEADSAATGAKIYSDGDRLEQMITVEETDPSKPMICLDILQEFKDAGSYGGRPLTGEARVPGDTLKLSFAGEYQRSDADKAKYPNNNDMFLMNAGQEDRLIGNITITEQNRLKFNEDNPNYTLYQARDNGVMSPGDNQVKGTVLRRMISDLQIASYPSALTNDGYVVYGEEIPLYSLRIRVFRNDQQIGDRPFDDFVVDDPTLDYDGSMAQAIDVHYNWVTYDEMVAGCKPDGTPDNTLTGSGCTLVGGLLVDSMPYKETNKYLNVSMDGMYLCAVAQKYESNDPAADPELGVNGYVKCYSQYPIHVRPRELTITLNDMSRFYGEESAVPTYTYSANLLSTSDLNRLHAHFPEGLTGEAEELLWLLSDNDGSPDPNFKAPELQYMKVPRLPENDQDENIVKVDTDVLGMDYYILISGAASTNYTFRYSRVDGTRQPSAEYGTAYLSIMKRPIVVQDIDSMFAGTVLQEGQTPFGQKETFAILYADSKKLRLLDQVDVDENGQTTHTPFSAPAATGVTFIAPSYDASTKTLSYYNAGNTNLRQMEGVDYTGDPVRADDLDKLSVSYHVQFLPDQNHLQWNSLSQNFYDVDALDATGGRDQRPVEIRDLSLTGEKAGNYVLVYNKDFHAFQQAPDTASQMVAPDPSATLNPGNATFLQYGTGLVILRPIKSMDILAVGDMSYTYGENFAPENPGLSGRQFTVAVNYDTRYDNDPAHYATDRLHNISYESVAYGYEDGGNTFAKRGFLIHYIDLDHSQLEHEVAPENQILMGGDALYPAVHDGMHLFVSGKRGKDDPLIYSTVTTSKLKVARADLTVTARDAHRYYGEENADSYVVQEFYDPADDVKPMTFTFQAAQLARWDRNMLGTVLGKTVAETDTLTQAQLESALEQAAASADADQRAWAAGFGYVAPTITTTATKTSPMNNTDKTLGQYPVNITTQNFTNYTVSGVGGTLYVYPRPIQVTAVANSQEDPVYTVYNQTAGRVFNTSFEQSRVTVIRSNANTGTVGWTRTLADGRHSAHLKLSGSPMVGSDSLIYKAVVQFDDTDLGKDETTGKDRTDAFKSVIVTIAQDGLASSGGEAEKNYILTAAFEDTDAVGAIKLRTIAHINIDALPKLKYNYGETLDLSGLKVRVSYRMLGDETSISDRVTVSYTDPDQFQSYGLYINYWDMKWDNTPPTTEAARKALPTAYRKAATGDHLTIAPTHDTQQFLGNNMSKPLERVFAANGMALIISAYQEGERQDTAQPKILAARLTKDPETGTIDVYDLTDTNTDAALISVAPRQLTYTISATDKTYNGDIRTAGTLRLTNLFDQTGVQASTAAAPDGSYQFPVRENVTDVVYVPIGAAYESVSQPDQYSSFLGTAYRVSGGAIAFTTGSYTNASTGYMDPNSAVSWASGYQWGKNLLEFTFPNANVHYEDDAFLAGLPGVGTAELAQYWRAMQDFNDVSGRWDTYPRVSQMPVEVNNMKFIGPDAANYTWGLSTAPRKDETRLTLDSDPAELGVGQANLPYATVNKANRQPIQDLLGSSYILPKLMVDEHTNVVRLYYGEDLERIQDLTGVGAEAESVRNDTGVDDYHDELHFEYALAYQDEDGLLTQWAGREGDRVYQDTLFFGGEVYLPRIDPNYQPDLEQLDKVEDANEFTVYKGQRYQWAKEDTGVSQRGYVEDKGFYIDSGAYPGYGVYGDEVRNAYWYYDLYNTDRAGLPRNTVYFPLVRLAETHNYNPSGDLTGDADGDGAPDISAKDIYDARVAVNAYIMGRNSAQAETLKAAAANKSAVVFTAGTAMDQAARKLAQDEVDGDAALADSGAWPETRPDGPAPISAIKTYHQRMDLISASWENDSSGNEYLVQFVEDIVFTDTLQYMEQRLLDAVVYNYPTRYYGYAWDPDMSAQLRFGDPENLVDLDRMMSFLIQQRRPGGEVVEMTWTYDPVASNNTAQIYVQITAGGGQTVRSIRIVPSILFARVGDKPVQLGLVTDPKMPLNRRYTWTSSDPSVVTVSATGLVTFRGEGTAVITVTTTNKKSDYITVVVGSLLPMNPTTSSIPIFNYYYTGAWANLDEGYAFRPKDKMTRGEVVRLLDLFLNPDGEWKGTKEMAYVDVTGKERYYGALSRLTAAGVVVGVPGSAFAGERPATRAEFITMLSRMLELDTPNTKGRPHAFVDSGEDATWAYSYIDAVAKAGIVKGTGGGYFAPSRDITREEAAAIIARLVVAQVDKDHVIVPSDVTPENWSYTAILRAVNTVMTPGV